MPSAESASGGPIPDSNDSESEGAAADTAAGQAERRLPLRKRRLVIGLKPGVRPLPQRGRLRLAVDRLEFPPQGPGNRRHRTRSRLNVPQWPRLHASICR
jgi:hypothetical protein